MGRALTRAAHALRLALSLVFLAVGLLLWQEVRRSGGIDAAGRLVLVLGLGLALLSAALVAWTALRARQYGPIQAQAAWSTRRTALPLIAAAWFGLSALLDLLIARSSSRAGLAGLEIGAASCCFGAGLFQLARLCWSVQLRRDGIVAEFIAIEWRRVRAYEWGGSDNSSLILRVSPSVTSLWSETLTFPLSGEGRRQVDRVLRARLGSPWSAHDNAYRS